MKKEVPIDSNSRFWIMGKGKTLNRALILIIVFLVVTGILFYFGFFTKACSDDDCFNDAMKFCRPIDYVKNVNNNIYLYTVHRSFGNECSLKISMLSAAPGSDIEVADLEGKSMRCKIPKSELITTQFEEVDNILGFCTGELKEGIYELIIKRMFGLVIGNIEEIREVVKGVV